MPGFLLTKDGLRLSKIGTIKIILHRPIQGKLKTCIVRRDIDRWYACFCVEYEPSRIIPFKNIKRIGIDVGISTFATLSTSQVIENPRYLKKAERSLSKRQRKLSKKKRGSSNRKKSRIIVANTYRKIKEQRRDFHHKVSRYLIDTFGFIAVEDLNIKGMVQNHHLAKSINDAAWGQFLSFLQYKAEEAGIGFERVVPKNTSIICSICGERVPKTLATRIHSCPYCKTSLNRDYNAAINILHKSTAGTAGSHAWGGTPVGIPANQEAPSFMVG